MGVGDPGMRKNKWCILGMFCECGEVRNEHYVPRAKGKYFGKKIKTQDTCLVSATVGIRSLVPASLSSTCRWEAKFSARINLVFQFFSYLLGRCSLPQRSFPPKPSRHFEKDLRFSNLFLKIYIKKVAFLNEQNQNVKKKHKFSN